MNNKIDQLNKRANRPLSPGEVVAGILEEQEITQTQAANHLGISRTSRNELINNRRALTPRYGRSPGTLFRQRHRRTAGGVKVLLKHVVWRAHDEMTGKPTSF